MKPRSNKPELLCPAGSPAALAAAIEGGADAVYMGGVAFNARIHAKNFTVEELRDGIALAHSYGVKVYITANTLIYDKEMDTMLRAAEDAYLCGADALIVADLGAARQIRQRIPIPLHASTQVSGHNADAAHLLADMGFSRMVCAREMSREDLGLFIQTSPIEAEVFVHGALCVCHSGQCLFSSLVGGRSGNRGECAQPCRLPFITPKGRTDYPLSLKDLSLAGHVSELMDMGVASFKIEGRMKSPEYVRDVASIWRRLLDEHRSANAKELSALAAIFSRGGLTDGYYTKQIDRRMLGVRSEEDKQSTRVLEPFEGITKKIPIRISATIKKDVPSSLSLLTKGGETVTVMGAIPESARTAPLDRDSVASRLSKLGNTPYVAESVGVELDEGVMLPVSALNALRRSAVEALQALANPMRSEKDFSARAKTDLLPKRAMGRSAVFYGSDQIPEEAYDFFDILYVPLDRYDGSTNGVCVPSVIFDSERSEIEACLRFAKERGAEHVLIGNLGQLSMVQEQGFVVHGDFRLNITNLEAAVQWRELGLRDWVLSPELTLPQLRDIQGGGRVIVYGRVPLMVTEKCVSKEIGECERCQRGELRLTDRRRVQFPVLKEWKHRSLIVNSVPIWMADRKEDLTKFGLSLQHFIFTTESRKQVTDVIRAYRKGGAPEGDIRRLR